MPNWALTHALTFHESHLASPHRGGEATLVLKVQRRSAYHCRTGAVTGARRVPDGCQTGSIPVPNCGRAYQQFLSWPRYHGIARPLCFCRCSKAISLAISLVISPPARRYRWQSHHLHHDCKLRAIRSRQTECPRYPGMARPLCS